MTDLAAIWYEYVLFHDKQLLFFMYNKHIYNFADIADFQYFLAAILDIRKSNFQPVHVIRGIKRSRVAKFHGPII